MTVTLSNRKKFPDHYNGMKSGTQWLLRYSGNPRVEGSSIRRSAK